MSSLLPSSVVVQPGLSVSDLFGNHEDRFCRDETRVKSFLKAKFSLERQSFGIFYYMIKFVLGISPVFGFP